MGRPYGFTVRPARSQLVRCAPRSDQVFAAGLAGTGQALGQPNGMRWTAYTFADGAWARIDTAEIRTMILAILQPGESADVRLPVKEADFYRVLVPVQGVAAWADVA